jgi:hypothetical protein
MTIVSSKGPTRFIYGVSCQTRPVANASDGGCGNFYQLGIFPGNESEWLASYFHQGALLFGPAAAPPVGVAQALPDPPTNPLRSLKTPTTPTMRLTELGQTVKASTRAWFAEQAKLTITGGAVFTGPPYAPQNRSNSTGHGSSSTCNLSGTWSWGGWGRGAPMVFAEQPSGGEQACPSFTITPPANWSWKEAHGVFDRDSSTLSIDYGPPSCKPNVGPPCQVNGSINSKCDEITVSHGLPGHGTFRREAGTMRYYSPDNASDPRTHYAGTYIRDFFYTFSMAPDILPAADISNTLDYFFSGQDRSTGSVSEGGTPPNHPINAVNCWDEGPFLALAAAKYATLFGDSAWLCGEHPAGGGRLQRLKEALEFLDVPTQKPQLVYATQPHCMYGFTDMEPKQGHVLFTSLLVIEAGVALSAAINAAAVSEAGCIHGMSAWFAELATTINASIADGFLDDRRPEGKIHRVDPKFASRPSSLTENPYKTLRVDPYSGSTL